MLMRFGIRAMFAISVITSLCTTTYASLKIDTEPPLVFITSTGDTFTIAADHTVISLSGTATDDGEPTNVMWKTDRGYTGSCAGYTNWSVSDLPVDPGDNLVTICATDVDNNIASESVLVTYNPPPVLVIATPTLAPICSATTDKITLSGTAETPFALAKVQWETDRGAKGECNGRSTWQAANVPLVMGENIVIVAAVDTNGNVGTDTLVVTVTDVLKPVVAIISPTLEQASTRNSPTLDIYGTASDNFGVASVSWSNDRGGNGICTGKTGWFNNGIALTIGTNVITIFAEDIVGNVGTASITVNYDPTKLAVISVCITSPTTAATTSATTNSIALSGTAVAELGLAKMTWRTDRGASGECIGLEHWSASGVPLVLNTTVITVTATDAASNVASSTLTITASDSSPPIVRIDIPSKPDASAHKGIVLAIAGVASDDFGVKEVNWSNSRGGSGKCSGTITWDYADISLSPGDNVITITAVDDTGNAATDSVIVTYPEDIPTIAVEIDFPTKEETLKWDSPTIELKGIATGTLPIHLVHWLTDAGRRGRCTGTTDWTASEIALGLGDTVITVSAVNSAGDVGTTALRVTIEDSTSPTVKITSPSVESASHYTLSNVTVSGVADDNLGLKEIRWQNNRGGSGIVPVADQWIIERMALQAGSNVITVTATDYSGNSGSDTIAVNYVSVDPSVTITTPTSLPAYTSSTLAVSIAGTALSPSSIATVRWSSDRGKTGKCDGTDTWNATEIPLEYGANNITILAIDANGESGAAHLAVTVPDPIPPTISIVSPTVDQATRRVGAGITITGNADDNVEVRNVTWSSGSGYSGVCYGTKSWLATWVPLQYGNNAITFTATDIFGNSCSSSINVIRLNVSPAADWRGLMMAAVPVVPDVTDPKLEVGFADGFWASFDAATQIYHQYPEKPTWFDPLESTPSRGFWSIFAWTQSEPIGYALPQDKEVSIHLYPGWNMLGNPFLTPIQWDRNMIMVQPAGSTDRRAMIDADEIIRQYGIGWQQNEEDLLTGNYYIIADIVQLSIVNDIKPWRAFWIKALQECDLIIPPPETTTK